MQPRTRASRKIIHDGYFDIAGRPGSIPALDGIRAFAIMLVLGRHAMVSLEQHGFLASGSTNVVLQWIQNFLFNGWIGVDLFFALSGTLIGLHLLKGSQPLAPQQLGKYYLRRIFRTFPLYYAIIILIIAGAIPLYQPGEGYSLSEILVHLFFMQDYYGTGILVPLWSLAVEEKFYLVAPFLIFLSFKIKSRTGYISFLLLLSLVSLFAKVVAVFATGPESYVEYFWLVRAPFMHTLDPLIMGMLCAYLYRHSIWTEPVGRRPVVVIGCFLVPLIVVLLLFRWMHEEPWLLTSIMLYLSAVAFAGIIFACMCSPKLNLGFLSGVFLRFVSKISYSLYLTHYTVIPLSWGLALKSNQAADNVLTAGIFVCYYLLLSFLFSIILHLLIEKPFLVLKDRVR